MAGAVGATIGNDTNGAIWGLPINILTPSNSAIIQTTVVGVVPDVGALNGYLNQGTSTSTLDVALQEEYFIKRLVGKIHLGFDHTQNSLQDCRVAAGFAICPAGKGSAFGSNTQLEELYPNGVDPTWGGTFDSNTNAAMAEATLLYSPLVNSTMRQPWIWRRSWMLSQLGGTGLWLPTNTQYGSVMDGPHIDQKTKRRVHKDERLFFIISAQSIGSTEENDGLVEGFLDLRMFASMRKAKDKGTW